MASNKDDELVEVPIEAEEDLVEVPVQKDESTFTLPGTSAEDGPLNLQESVLQDPTTIPLGIAKGASWGTSDLAVKKALELAGKEKLAKDWELFRAKQQEDNKVLSGLSELYGGLATGGAEAKIASKVLGSSAKGKALLDAWKAQKEVSPVLTEMSEGIVHGSVPSAVYGAATAEEGNRLESAQEGALFGALAGAPIGAVAGGLQKASQSARAGKLEKLKNSMIGDFRESYEFAKDTGVNPASQEGRKILAKDIETLQENVGSIPERQRIQELQAKKSEISEPLKQTEVDILELEKALQVKKQENRKIIEAFKAKEQEIKNSHQALTTERMQQLLKDNELRKTAALQELKDREIALETALEKSKQKQIDLTSKIGAHTAESQALESQAEATRKGLKDVQAKTKEEADRLINIRREELINIIGEDLYKATGGDESVIGKILRPKMTEALAVADASGKTVSLVKDINQALEEVRDTPLYKKLETVFSRVQPDGITASELEQIRKELYALEDAFEGVHKTTWGKLYDATYKGLGEFDNLKELLAAYKATHDFNRASKVKGVDSQTADAATIAPLFEKTSTKFLPEGEFPYQPEIADLATKRVEGILEPLEREALKKYAPNLTARIRESHAELLKLRHNFTEVPTSKNLDLLKNQASNLQAELAALEAKIQANPTAQLNSELKLLEQDVKKTFGELNQIKNLKANPEALLKRYKIKTPKESEILGQVEKEIPLPEKPALEPTEELESTLAQKQLNKKEKALQLSNLENEIKLLEEQYPNVDLHQMIKDIVQETADTGKLAMSDPKKEQIYKMFPDRKEQLDRMFKQARMHYASASEPPTSGATTAAGQATSALTRYPISAGGFLGKLRHSSAGVTKGKTPLVDAFKNISGMDTSALTQIHDRIATSGGVEKSKELLKNLAKVISMKNVRERTPLMFMMWQDPSQRKILMEAMQEEESP